MDFYGRQAAARSQSRWLVLGFMLSLLAVAVALDLVLFTFLARAGSEHDLASPVDFAVRNPGAALASTLIVMGILGLASLYKSMELRGGGGVVARDLGGVLVAPDTTDLKRKRLLNVVSEMAIASGVPMPEVYVLEQEPAINAFAAGHAPANAAVTVTQGALERLNREQLQGVIGHEFSHILNGDMRLNVQLMGWVFGLFVIALIGRLILNFSPRDRRGNNGWIALGFAVMVLGYVGLFLGRLLQAAVARQRERLADASGVQFTRNPQGLKEALVKIAAMPEGSRLLTPHAEQAAHMLFAPGLSRLFATHPPLLERIRELDPQFDEREIAKVAAEMEGAGAGVGADGVDAVPGGRFGSGVGSGAGAVALGAGGVGPSASGVGPGASGVGPGTGSPDSFGARAQAAGLAPEAPRTPTGVPPRRLASLPDAVREFQSPGRAQAFVLALLLSKDPGVRERQLALLRAALSVANVGVVQQISPTVDAIDPLLRLPALQQVFPLLRRVPVAQRRTLAQLASELIHADARIDVFEFCLAMLLETLLNDELEARVPHGTASLEDLEDDVRILFAGIAQLGSQDERGAHTAYEAGMTVVLPMRRPEYAPLADWPRQLSSALRALQQLDPVAKKTVIDGLVKTVCSDEVMTEAEAELVRTVCALLSCPLPAMLGGSVNPGSEMR
jgi:Zn-dependent protease with chaperone function